MIEAATIAFREVDSGDDAVVIVRYDAATLALCFSLKSNGDLEVRMKKEDAKRFIDALSKGM